MKNIHILPTNKLSKLYVRNDVTPIFYSNFQGDAVNIYITSDEEIKEGDWCYNSINEIFKVFNLKNYKYQFSKIILTTDRELIDDGVQKIDEEFLAWFLKNSSCENVEVKSEIIYEHIDTHRPYPSDCKNLTKTKAYYYLSIIPKEESKQIYYNTVGVENGKIVTKGQFNTQKEALDLANKLNEKGLGVHYDYRETLIEENFKEELHSMDKDVECNTCGNLMSLSEENMYACFNSECTRCYEEPKKETIVKRKCVKCGNSEYNIKKTYCTDEFCNKGFYQTPKQAALEEAMTQNGYHDKPSDDLWREGVEFGVKWQAEKMYSEEEILEIITKWEQQSSMKEFPEEWLKQFKKK